MTVSDLALRLGTAQYVSTNCLTVVGGRGPGNIPRGVKMGWGTLSSLNSNINSSLSGNKHKKHIQQTEQIHLKWFKEGFW